MLNRILGPDDQDVRREQKIRGEQLPEFDAIRRYLGPAGCYSRSEDNGWFFTGVLLNKQARYVDGSLPTAVTASREDSGSEN
jgi:hypothetical protein